MWPLIFLVLPTLAYCRITVTIQASNSSSTSTILLRGTDSSVISDAEQLTFGLTDEVLKDAAEKYSGGRPQDVFLHSPTPWNDLYQTYDWSEVKRVLRPVKSHVLDVKSETETVNLKGFDNNSTYSVLFDGSLMSEVEDVVTNKWSKAGILNIKEPIYYHINGSAAFSYTSPWGINMEEIKKMTIGPSANVEVTLRPGESVSAALVATKVTMTVQIDYAANLSGHVACNYPVKYNGHHFWRYDIDGLMGASKLIRTVNSSEVISVKFYTGANIVVTDKKTRAKLSEVPAELSYKQ